MIEGKVLARVKKPLMSEEMALSEGYEMSIKLWSLWNIHLEHGGLPVISGVVTQDIIQGTRQFPRYKLEFPDGFVDYVRIDNFHAYYDMVTV